MARRPTLRERQQVIASIIAMWFEMMQQYMILLSKLAVAQTLLASNHRADPTFLALPLPRIVYRVGFMHYATKTNADSIKGKFRVFKGKFHAQLDLMNASGMGWNADKSCCECDPEVFVGWVKSHKLAAGLNNTKLHRWDELCKIFEVHRADGTSSMTAKDAAFRLDGQLRSPPPASDTYAAETTPMMEDFINQGYDMNAEGLQDIEEDTATNQSTDKGKGTSSAGSKRSPAKVTEEYLASINENMVSFQEHIARTTTNIERLTNNWCMPEDVASRRAYMMDEIKRLPGISYRQGLLAMRILMKDLADWETFCMLPTDETKADFILTILE